MGGAMAPSLSSSACIGSARGLQFKGTFLCPHADQWGGGTIPNRSETKSAGPGERAPQRAARWVTTLFSRLRAVLAQRRAVRPLNLGIECRRRRYKMVSGGPRGRSLPRIPPAPGNTLGARSVQIRPERIDREEKRGIESGSAPLRRSLGRTPRERGSEARGIRTSRRVVVAVAGLSGLPSPFPGRLETESGNAPISGAGIRPGNGHAANPPPEGGEGRASLVAPVTGRPGRGGLSAPPRPPAALSAQDPDRFEVRVTSPPPRSLGVHSLPPNTSSGEVIEVEGDWYMVKKMVCQVSGAGVATARPQSRRAWPVARSPVRPPGREPGAAHRPAPQYQLEKGKYVRNYNRLEVERSERYITNMWLDQLFENSGKRGSGGKN